MPVPLLAPLVTMAAGQFLASKGKNGRGRQPGPARQPSRSGLPPVEPAVLEALPTNRLLGLINEALDTPERAPRLNLQTLAEAGASIVSDARAGQEVRAVKAIRQALGGENRQTQRRELRRIQREATQLTGRVTAELRAYNPRAPAAQRQSIATRLRDAALGLHTFALEALGRNVEFAGACLEIIAQRVATAARLVGEGAGDAFAAFWGVRPATLGLGAAFVALSLAAIGGYLLLSPGGQGVLIGAGKGYASLGAGTGKLLGKTGVAAVKLAT